MANKGTKATGLYGDQRGRIACLEHAPLRGSDTWTFDQWKPLSAREATRFEEEIGRPAACETCRQEAGKVAEADPAPTPASEAGAAEPGWVEVTATDAGTHQKNGSASGHAAPREESAEATATAPAKPRKTKKAKGADLTLAQLAERYLAHLDESGKSQGTLFSYKLELVVAMEEIGAETRLADLTPERVLTFFISSRVMKTRTGVAKARPTFEKTRRVLRQALVWAAEARLITKAPLPEDAASY